MYEFLCIFQSTLCFSYLIVRTRPCLSSDVTQGKGNESAHYKHIKYYFMEIGNIHAMRVSYDALLVHPAITAGLTPIIGPGDVRV